MQSVAISKISDKFGFFEVLFNCQRMQPFKKSHWILLYATAVAINACNFPAATDKSPRLNTSLSIPERVDLLVARISVGGGQPGKKVKTSSNILQTSVTIMK